jgi:hypothetical protein
LEENLKKKNAETWKKSVDRVRNSYGETSILLTVGGEEAVLPLIADDNSKFTSA